MKTAHDIRKTSRRQERRTAAEIGGRVQTNSGATRHGGADVRERGKTRVECKYTGKSTYILKLADLLKLRQQAIKGGLEMPVFKIGFAVTGQRMMDEVAVLRWNDYLALCHHDSAHLTRDCFVAAQQYQLTRAEALTLLTGQRIRLGFEVPHEVTLTMYLIMPWADYLALRGE